MNPEEVRAGALVGAGALLAGPLYKRSAWKREWNRRFAVLTTETLLVLLQAECRTPTAVQALCPEAVAALPPAAAQEVKQYLARLLRESLGRGSEDALGDQSVLSLVEAGCRTQPNVQSVSKEAVVALPAVAAQELAEYLLRGPLGRPSRGVVGSETLRLLLQAGCRTQAAVQALGADRVASLPAAA